MFARTVLPVAVLALGAAAPSAPQQPSATADQRQWAETCKDWDEWDKPGPPFRIAENTYYVGTCGIAAILITGDQGHVLIDGGPANAGALVARNIEALGFRLTDVKILLHSHEHNDHVGGLAELQRLTGARLLASPAAARAFTTGGASPDDPQFDEHNAIPTARVDGEVHDADVIRLGSVALHAIATPGHTEGALSWSWDAAADPADRETIVYADSLTPVSSDGYRFSDHPAYVSAFRESLAKIAARGCRAIFTPHPSASGMRDKIVAGQGFAASPTACADYASAGEARLDERLAKEASPE